MRSLLITALILSTGVACSQEKFADRIFYGGGFGFSAGSNVTNISLSPQVGYWVTQRLLTGFGVTYQYVRFRNIDSAIENYGWSLFTRYNITRQFFTHVEYEQLNFEFFTGSNEQTSRDTYNAFLIGAGYSEAIGGRAAFSVTALYNVLYDTADDPQPYNSPWIIRAGIGVGFL